MCMCVWLQAMGLATVRSFARLLPLLLEWAHAPDQDTRLAALQALHTVLARTWPRLPTHAGLIWQHVADEYKSETRIMRADCSVNDTAAAASSRNTVQQQAGAGQTCEAGENAEHADEETDKKRQEALVWLERVARVLWWSGGEPFREGILGMALSKDLSDLVNAARKLS